MKLLIVSSLFFVASLASGGAVPTCENKIIEESCTCDGEVRTEGSCFTNGATYVAVCDDGVISGQSGCVCRDAVRTNGECSGNGATYTAATCANGIISSACLCADTSGVGTTEYEYNGSCSGKGAIYTAPTRPYHLGEDNINITVGDYVLTTTGADTVELRVGNNCRIKWLAADHHCVNQGNSKNNGKTVSDCANLVLTNSQVKSNVYFSMRNERDHCYYINQDVNDHCTLKRADDRYDIYMIDCGTDSPTVEPTMYPTRDPTTKDPTSHPTRYPSDSPIDPTMHPTRCPTDSPIDPTMHPTVNPTENPSSNPTMIPSSNPTKNPSNIPSSNPTKNPSNIPSSNPTNNPSSNPTKIPSMNPTSDPSVSPTSNPTINPTMNPTDEMRYGMDVYDLTNLFEDDRGRISADPANLYERFAGACRIFRRVLRKGRKECIGESGPCEKRIWNRRKWMNANKDVCKPESDKWKTLKNTGICGKAKNAEENYIWGEDEAGCSFMTGGGTPPYEFNTAAFEKLEKRYTSLKKYYDDTYPNGVGPYTT